MDQLQRDLKSSLRGSYVATKMLRYLRGVVMIYLDVFQIPKNVRGKNR